MNSSVFSKMSYLRLGLVVSLVGPGTPACGKGESKSSAANSAVGGSAAASGHQAGGPAGGGSDVVQAPARGPEHPIYSLVDNRLSAHLVRDGALLVPGGSAGFIKYLRFRKQNLPWKVGEERDGEKGATIDGRNGGINVPLTADQIQAGTKLHMRVYNEAARRLSVRINGDAKQEGSAELAAGWSTVSVDIPDGLFKAGENEILLFTSKGAPMTVEWFQIGGPAPAGDDVTRFYDGADQSLLLPEKGGLAYYLMLPEKVKLTGDLGDPKCEVAVRAFGEQGDPVTGTLRGRGSAVDLAPLGGKAVRLELTGVGCPQAKLQGAALVRPGPAPVYERPPDSTPKYVIFWVMDSLRADRVKTFTPGARPDVPAFDSLEQRATLFVDAYAQGTETKSSYASMWASLYALNHGFYTDRDKLADKWTTIDEMVKSVGYYASGVSANGYIISRRGFGTKWDAYRNHIHEPGGLRCKDVYDKGIESIEGKKDPWFLYMGSIDTHVSWRAEEPWISKYDPEPYNGRFKTVASGADIGKVATGQLKITERDKEHIRAIYDSNVSYQDEYLGKLLAKLDEWGIADQTLLVVTGDHGDEQWEVGRVGHGGSVRESLIHVPLVFLYPKLFPAGKNFKAAELIDILPTIADAIGAKPDPEWQGESLIPLANGVGAEYPHLRTSSLYENAHAGRIGPWKMRIAGISTPSLYNLVEEPDEKNDRIDEDPIALRVVSDPLWLFRANSKEWKKARWGNPANVSPQFAADLGE